MSSRSLASGKDWERSTRTYHWVKRIRSERCATIDLTVKRVHTDSHQIAVASNVFFFLTIALTKVAVILLCRRLFSTNMKKHLIFCDAVSGLVGVWCIASILATNVGCGPLGQLGYRQDFCTGMVCCRCSQCWLAPLTMTRSLDGSASVSLTASWRSFWWL